MSHSQYQQLCDIVEMPPVQQTLSVECFADFHELAQQAPSQRLTSGLQILIDLITNDDKTIHRCDRSLVDVYISKIDQMLSQQLDEILHHEDFQQLESTWKGLKYLVDRTDPRANTKIDLLDVDQETLLEDFDEASEVTQSSLYEHVYIQEYDTPGGEPYSAMISDFAFGSDTRDMALLKSIANVAASAHCPFISAADITFFKKNNFQEIMAIENLSDYMEKPEFIEWNAFRKIDDARYLGLTLPHFLLRLPYGKDNLVKSFNYQENVISDDGRKYLWGRASFPFAVNMMKSFKQHGWTVNIRGPESGGCVPDLPMHQYDVGRGIESRIPTEVLIPETLELELSELGFIPLSFYKNSNFACFFSANSVQRADEYGSYEATANCRINMRLPYVLLVSRLAHYLKVLQRENIGANKPRVQLESELNDWLKGLVTKMNNPSPDMAARYPLREGFVEVHNIDGKPGFYSVKLHIVPHFQVEGVDVRLSLVSQLPGKQEDIS